MAITKERKEQLIAQYSQWIEQSKGVVVTEYMGLTMKDFDALRAKIREAGGEFHVVKNTLMHARPGAGRHVCTGWRF